MRILALYLLALVACSSPPTLVADPPRWPHLPITIILEPDAEDYRPSLTQAMGLWDGAMGRRMFVLTEGTADVVVGLGSVGGHAGTCSFSLGPHARVELHGVADVGAAYYLLAHELGHVLGLAHDPGERSIMVPALDDGGLMAAGTLPMYLVQREDVDAVLALYR